MKTTLLALCALAAALSVHPARGDEITIYAASSLEAPLREYSARFQKETGHTFKFVFGRSDELVRSIQAGARGDLFFSSSDELMDQAENAEKLISGTRYALLSNFLVIAVPPGDIGNPPASAIDLTKPEVKKLGLVKPDSAPVGKYAREYLEKAKLWEQVAGKIVPYENTQALIKALDRRDVDAALIFKTDALLSKNVRIAMEIDRGERPRITYVLSALVATRQPDPAALAVLYLCKPEAMEIFEKYGFNQLRGGSKQ